MSQPLISVIIPNYNYAHFLPQAIESVLAQTYPRIEIVVVDDGSKDNSIEVLKSYGARVRVIEQQNQGVARVRNRGVAESGGEYVAFLDADDLWLPSKIEKQVARLLAEPGLGLVHCGVEEIDKAGAPLRLLLNGQEGWVAKELVLFERAVILGGGSGFIVSRSVFESLGGFDARLSTSADWDFFFRVAARHKIGFLPEPLVRYRMHGTNMHGNIKLMEHDMLLAYSKAFTEPAPEIERLRRRSYGNLHMTLAGSYFRNGRPFDFARHAFRSLWFTPSKLTYLLGLPIRSWRRRRMSRQTSLPAS